MSAALAVLEHAPGTGDLIRAPGASYRLTRSLHALDDFRALAERLDTYQLWIHPSFTRAHPRVQLCAACADTHPDGRRWRRSEHTHWLVLDLPGMEVQHCQLAIVAGDQELESFAGTADGPELLALLQRVAYLMGTYWHGTPGRTGLVLLRESLARSGARLESLPPEVRGLPREPDFGWQRPLTEAESSRRYVYCFDKHQMYAVAASTVVLGSGEVEFKANPAGFSARLPAYWYVQLADWPADSSLPDPTLAAGPDRLRHAERPHRWLTTPTVEAALSAGTVEHIAAAWYWPHHGRYLQTIAKRLRLAIASIAQDAAGGDRLASLTRDVLKAIYTELLGGYLARAALAQTDDPLYRPDWRDMVKAEARARLWYSLRPLAAAGIAPFAISTDAIYLASDADNPADALAGLLRLGELPRQWAYKGRVALADTLDAQVDAVGSSRALARRVRLLRAL